MARSSAVLRVRLNGINCADDALKQEGLMKYALWAIVAAKQRGHVARLKDDMPFEVQKKHPNPDSLWQTR